MEGFKGRKTVEKVKKIILIVITIKIVDEYVCTVEM